MAGGQFGTWRTPGFIDPGTSALTGHVPPGATAGPSLLELEQYAVAAARDMLNSVGGIDTRSTIGYFLGDHSFTAGVIVGMGQSLVDSAIELVKFFKMLALADYYEAQHLPGFWNKFRNPLMAPAHGAMALAGYFWPEFDEEAKAAYEDRQVLFETVKYAFTHPKEVFEKITESQVKRYEEFNRYLDQKTLAGQFHAGVLFGELLIDLLMVVGGAAALAKLAAKIPGLSRLLTRLTALTKVVKRPPKVVKLLPPAPEAPKLPSGQTTPPVRPRNTRFVEGVEVKDKATGKVQQGTVDLKPTLDRIESGQKYPHKNDGSIFMNKEGRLPTQPPGYYTEYVHPTPGINGVGPQRIVVGQGGEIFYTPDHYKTFIPVNH